MRFSLVRAGAAALIVLSSACSAGTVAPPSARDDWQPQAMPAGIGRCPAVGSMQTSGKGSARVTGVVAVAGGPSQNFSWKIEYRDLTQAEYTNIAKQATSGTLFTTRLVACGALAKPVGTIGGYSGSKLSGGCNNGKCHATIDYTLRFNPPKSLAKIARFDLLRFARKGRAPIPAARIAVKVHA